MDHRDWVRWTLLSLATAVVAGSCAKNPEKQIGDETHFACGTDDDCKTRGTGLSCVAGMCELVERPDASMVRVDSGTPDVMTRQETAPPGTPLETCPTPIPGPPQGLCAIPLPACKKGNTNACYQFGNAPGVEACFQSIGSEYGTRCCLTTGGGGCAFDYGNGCTGEPHSLPGQTADGFATCNGTNGSVERVYDFTASNYATVTVAMNDAFVYVLDGSGPRQVVAISKATCATSVIHEADYIEGLAATTGEVYFVVNSSELFWSGGGPAAAIALPQALRAPDVQLGAVGSNGQTAYVAAVQFGPASSNPFFLAAIPPGNAAPSIVGTGSVSASSVGGQLVQDGNRIFLLSEQLVTDAGPLLTVAHVDLATHAASVVFDYAWENQLIKPLGVHGGRPYFVQDGQLTSMEVDSCASSAVVKDRLFATVPAFAEDDRAIYWAETYNELTVSRIFMILNGTGDVVKVLEPSGQVLWIGVDSTHLYFAESFDPYGPSPRIALSRVALPK